MFTDMASYHINKWSRILAMVATTAVLVMLLAVLMGRAQDAAVAQVTAVDQSQSEQIIRLDERQQGVLKKIEVQQEQLRQLSDKVTQYEKDRYLITGFGGIAAIIILILQWLSYASGRKLLMVPRELREQCADQDGCPLAKQLHQIDPRK